ncbi:unnamed protein product [Dovyalis caffra]|uniref:Uncharacterized protein n=1 Tax=Dovyalis caffra TaxID=77055 RepID=A0AAV1RB64_9ROSI|nr:unnamed protein product [Dovyalis caffra]
MSTVDCEINAGMWDADLDWIKGCQEDKALVVFVVNWWLLPRPKRDLTNSTAWYSTVFSLEDIWEEDRAPLSVEDYYN